MPLANLLTTGVELMLLGMGIVFGFLILLVLVVKAMSWFAARVAGSDIQPSHMPARPAGVDDTTIAVISAAVGRYRATRRQ